ncbi:MAG: glutathione S-transferase family protein [Pseudomonadota bacterium]
MSVRLIGQYDSPFVRRVAIVLHHYGVPFERQVLSVFTDFDALLEVNPLGKVPALVLDSGEHLFDSRMIIDYLTRQVPVADRLVPETDADRFKVMQAEAVALGLAEKAYERGIEYARRQPDKVDEVWSARLARQIASALDWLDAREPAPWLCGDSLSLADISCATAFTFLREKQQIALSRGQYPALDAHCDRCEALPAFRSAAYSAAEAHASGWRLPGSR